MNNFKKLLSRFGYSIVSYESGKRSFTIDRDLTLVRVSWRSGSRIVKNGKVLVINDLNEIFAKIPESQDHRNFITIPVNTLNR